MKQILDVVPRTPKLPPRPANVVQILESSLRTVVGAMVSDPDAVVISVEDVGDSVDFKVTAAPPDMGKLIGRSGRTADALRVVFQAIGHLNGVRVSLGIGEWET